MPHTRARTHTCRAAARPARVLVANAEAFQVGGAAARDETVAIRHIGAATIAADVGELVLAVLLTPPSTVASCGGYVVSILPPPPLLLLLLLLRMPRTAGDASGHRPRLRCRAQQSHTTRTTQVLAQTESLTSAQLPLLLLPLFLLLLVAVCRSLMAYDKHLQPPSSTQHT